MNGSNRSYIWSDEWREKKKDIGVCRKTIWRDRWESGELAAARPSSAVDARYINAANDGKTY